MMKINKLHWVHPNLIIWIQGLFLKFFKIIQLDYCPLFWIRVFFGYSSPNFLKNSILNPILFKFETCCYKDFWLVQHEKTFLCQSYLVFLMSIIPTNTFSGQMSNFPLIVCKRGGRLNVFSELKNSSNQSLPAILSPASPQKQDSFRF